MKMVRQSKGAGEMENWIEPQPASPCLRTPDLGPWWPPRNAADVKALAAAGVRVSLADIRPGDWTWFELSMSESDFECALCHDIPLTKADLLEELDRRVKLLTKPNIRGQNGGSASQPAVEKS